MRVVSFLMMSFVLSSTAQAQRLDDVHTVVARSTWDPGFAGLVDEVVYDNASVFCQRPTLAQSQTFSPPTALATQTPCGGPWLKAVKVDDDDVPASIVIHHSDFADSPGPVVIRDYHLQVAGYSDIAYHFVVMPDGRIYEGRPIHLLGAHAGISAEGRTDKSRDPDFHAIGIVLDGFYGIDGPPPAQTQALAWLVHALRIRYDVAAHRIYGHRDVKQHLVEARGLHLDSKPTTCPGAAAYPLVGVIRARELLE